MHRGGSTADWDLQDTTGRCLDTPVVADTNEKPWSLCHQREVGGRRSEAMSRVQREQAGKRVLEFDEFDGESPF